MMELMELESGCLWGSLIERKLNEKRKQCEQRRSKNIEQFANRDPRGQCVARMLSVRPCGYRHKCLKSNKLQ